MKHDINWKHLVLSILLLDDLLKSFNSINIDFFLTIVKFSIPSCIEKKNQIVCLLSTTWNILLRSNVYISAATTTPILVNHMGATSFQETDP